MPNITCPRCEAPYSGATICAKCGAAMHLITVAPNGLYRVHGYDIIGLYGEGATLDAARGDYHEKRRAYTMHTLAISALAG
jgi:hypothetical protein